MISTNIFMAFWFLIFLNMSSYSLVPFKEESFGDLNVSPKKEFSFSSSRQQDGAINLESL